MNIASCIVDMFLESHVAEKEEHTISSIPKALTLSIFFFFLSNYEIITFKSYWTQLKIASTFFFFFLQKKGSLSWCMLII